MVLSTKGRKHKRRPNWLFDKVKQRYLNPDWEHFDVIKCGGAGTLNPYMLSYTDPNGDRVMIRAEPDWLWLRHTLETQGKDFMRNPHKFKGVVGYYTCKKTGKYKPKTIKPFTHLTPREI